MSKPFAEVGSAPWKDVLFSCGHQEWIYSVEYGDMSAWCSQCDELRDYDAGHAAESNSCAECGDTECGPGSCCAACGHIDWREADVHERKPVTDDDWGWRAALSDDDVISLPPESPAPNTQSALPTPKSSPEGG